MRAVELGVADLAAAEAVAVPVAAAAVAGTTAGMHRRAVRHPLGQAGAATPAPGPAAARAAATPATRLGAKPRPAATTTAPPATTATVPAMRPNPHRMVSPAAGAMRLPEKARATTVGATLPAPARA